MTDTIKKDLHAELMLRVKDYASFAGTLQAVDTYARTLTDRLERAERMFGAACADLGAINEALGLDPDDGGAEPILDAIKELQANAPPLLTDDERRDEQARHEAVIERLIPPLLTDDERRDEQAAFSAIELAAHVYADAYTELQCDSDNDRQRDHRRALTEMRRVIRAEITRFSRGNRGRASTARAQGDICGNEGQAKHNRGKIMKPHQNDDDMRITTSTDVLLGLQDRIAELEAQLEAVGAGGVGALARPLEVAASVTDAEILEACGDFARDAIGKTNLIRIGRQLIAFAASRAPVALPAEPTDHDQLDAMALDRYKVVATTGGFWPFAVVAGDGTAYLYIGQRKTCEQVARRLAGAFLDGAFTATHPQKDAK